MTREPRLEITGGELLGAGKCDQCGRESDCLIQCDDCGDRVCTEQGYPSPCFACTGDRNHCYRCLDFINDFEQPETESPPQPAGVNVENGFWVYKCDEFIPVERAVVSVSVFRGDGVIAINLLSHNLQIRMRPELAVALRDWLNWGIASSEAFGKVDWSAEAKAAVESEDECQPHS